MRKTLKMRCPWCTGWHYFTTSWEPGFDTPDGHEYGYMEYEWQRRRGCSCDLTRYGYDDPRSDLETMASEQMIDLEPDARKGGYDPWEDRERER